MNSGVRNGQKRPIPRPVEVSKETYYAPCGSVQRDLLHAMREYQKRPIIRHAEVSKETSYTPCGSVQRDLLYAKSNLLYAITIIWQRKLILYLCWQTSGILVLVGLFCLIIGLFWHVRIPQLYYSVCIGLFCSLAGLFFRNAGLF